METADQTALPSALLLISPGCVHCPVVLEGLSKLIKAGKLRQLEVVNLAADPARAQALGVRSVPWTRIGPFELEGSQSYAELERWISLATRGTGIGEYYSHLLEDRKLERVVRLIREAPETVIDLLRLLEDEDTPMAVQIGIGAVMEDLQGHDAFKHARPELTRLTESPNERIRADACHYLGLSGDADAAADVEKLMNDPSAEVREIAAETLALLNSDKPQ